MWLEKSLAAESAIGRCCMVECISNTGPTTGGTVTLDQWFELRVAGSAGTEAGAAAGVSEGIAVGESGRLCSLASGGARRFESRQEALDYLGKIKVSGDYQFEAVLCRGKTAASQAAVRESR